MDVEIPRKAVGMDKRVQGAHLIWEEGLGKNQGLRRQAGEERHERGKESQRAY